MHPRHCRPRSMVRASFAVRRLSWYKCKSNTGIYISLYPIARAHRDIGKFVRDTAHEKFYRRHMGDIPRIKFLVQHGYRPKPRLPGCLWMGTIGQIPVSAQPGPPTTIGDAVRCSASTLELPLRERTARLPIPPPDTAMKPIILLRRFSNDPTSRSDIAHGQQHHCH